MIKFSSFFSSIIPIASARRITPQHIVAIIIQPPFQVMIHCPRKE